MRPFNSIIEMPPIAAKTLDDPAHTGDNASGRFARSSGSCCEAYRNASLQKKDADLMDPSRPRADQATSHALRGLFLPVSIPIVRATTVSVLQDMATCSSFI